MRAPSTAYREICLMQPLLYCIEQGKILILTVKGERIYEAAFSAGVRDSGVWGDVDAAGCLGEGGKEQTPRAAP